MRVLFTSPVLEHPAAGGPQLRIENSIKALAKVCELDIICRATGSSQYLQKNRDFFQQFCDEYQQMPVSTYALTQNKPLNFAKRVLNKLFNLRVNQEAEYIVAHIDRRQINIIWFGYGNISYPLMKRIKALRPQVKLICDTDSVWSRYVLRELPYATGKRAEQIYKEGKLKEAEERAWVNLCDVTTAVSEVDAEYYRSIALQPERIRIFSNVIDVETYSNPPVAPEGFKKPSIYLAGSFWHESPMSFATQWVLDEIFPLVLEKHPEVHFYIVGNNSNIEFAHLDSPNVTVTGRLETVLPYLCNTDVALVPLKFESGTRYKILEAGACKIPIVSTVLGAEGIPVTDGKDILLADEPQDFANAIIRLLEDKALANTLAINCCDLVNRYFSVDALVAEAKQIFAYINKS